MKDTFHEFFRPSEDEFISLWQSGLISFDANTLLNLYRYSPSSSDALVDLIKTYTDRIRLPYQFSHEYARNRPKVIMKQVQNYIDAEKAFTDFERDWIQSNRQHPHLSAEAKEKIKQFRKELTEKRKSMEGLLSVDRYLDFLLTACAGKIGQAPSAERLIELHSIAKDRYEKLIPPGYCDQEKGVPGAYGDYIAWEQLISISTGDQKGMILVIDDVKEDWWWKESGRTIGPRHELLAEFQVRSGNRVWLYTSEGFLRAAQKYANADVPDELLKEVIEQQEEARLRLEAKGEKPPLDTGDEKPFDVSGEKSLSPKAVEKPESQMETAKPNIRSTADKPDGEPEMAEI
jgi:hypothetical protein